MLAFSSPTYQALCQDSLKVVEKNALPGDSATSADSVVKVPTKDKFKTTINYDARDSIRFDVATNIVYLYGKAHIDYGDIILDADYIEIDWNTSILTATYTEDSLGNKIGIPVFQEDDDTYEAWKIRYNFKTKKGIMDHLITQQGEGNVRMDKVKKDADDNFYIIEGKYTTCNLEHPHFFIKARKLKLDPGKHVVTGPFNLHIADIPTPLGFIFGLFPLPKKRASGIIFPVYGESATRGFFLRNGGYYWAVNDYLGLRMTGDIYTNGSWRTQLDADYKSRYKFNGDFSVKYARVFEGFDSETATKTNDFKLIWRHNTESKGSSRFSSSVNFGSITYDRNNSFDINNYQSNIFQSTITYSKSFRGTPFSLGVSARHNQNASTGYMAFTLPDVNLSMNRIYPFRDLIDGKGWGVLKNLNVNYRMNFQNKMDNNPRTANYAFPVNEAFVEDTFQANLANADLFLKRAAFGIKHTANVSTTFKLLKNINATPNFKYEEIWYPKQLSFDVQNDTINTDTLSQFSRVYNFSGGINLNTWLYGTYYLNSKKIKGFRHIMSPSVGFNYRPDFSNNIFGFYDEFTLSGTDYLASKYQGQAFIFGGPAAGTVGSITFALQNTLEMKVWQRTDSTVTDKKITLIESFNINTSYNLAADSLNLAPFRLSGRTKLFGFDINAGMIIDPYLYNITAIDSTTGAVTGQRKINEFAWNNKEGLGQITQADFSISKSFQPKKKKEDKTIESEHGTEEELEFIRNNPNLYVDFDIPWSLQVNYRFNYTKTGFFEAQTFQSVTVSGDLSITDKWKVSGSGSYDIENGEFSTIQFNIHRDLHCWEMRFSWIPFGFRQSYSFDINVRASVLQDLKLSRRRSWYDN